MLPMSELKWLENSIAIGARQGNRGNNHVSPGTIPANSLTNSTYIGISHSREVMASYLHDPLRLPNLTKQFEGLEAGIRTSMVNHLEPSTPVPSRSSYPTRGLSRRQR
jgi:hypothetical protein